MKANFNDEASKFLEMKQDVTPYNWIDGKVQKIVINHGINYRSTSQDEVLERRIFLDAAKRMTAMSKFITKPVDPMFIRRD